jgi:copper chaperone
VLTQHVWIRRKGASSVAIPQSKVFRVDGMSCQHCKMAVESMVGKLSGVESVSVDLAAGTVEVKYNAEQVDTEAIEGAIAGAGYDVVKDS